MKERSGKTEVKAMQKKNVGIKSMTKPGSVPIRLAKGGQEYVRDNTKKRLYKVKGE